MMDLDLDFSLAPSGTIYGARAIKLDTANEGKCYLGSRNSMCIGVTPQQSEQAPGMIGNTSTPFPLAEPADTGFMDGFAAGSVTTVPVYGEGRKCLIDIDPNFGGQIKPGDLVISSDSGYGRKATPSGPWNQWVVGIALTFANSGQSCNITVKIFPWMPTGS